MPKLLKFEEFLVLEPGVIFSTSDEWGNVKGLFRKGTSLETSEDNRDYYRGIYADFFYHALLPDAEDGDATKWPDINDGRRWGNFDPDELFVVYDADDIKKLVGMLTGESKVEDERPNGGYNRRQA